MKTPLANSLLIRATRSPWIGLYATAAYFALAALVTPEIASLANLQGLAVSLAPLMVLAAGQTLVIVSGGIDLSLTGVVAYASVLGAMTMTSESLPAGGSVIAGVVVVLTVGAIAGAANGVAVAWLGMPPFLTTLVTLMFFNGLAQWQTRSQPIGMLPEEFIGLSFSNIIGVPVALLLAAAATAVAHLWLRHALTGQRLYAVGQNRATARVSGLPVARTIFSAYVACGLLAGVATLLYMMRLEAGKPDLVSETVLLDAVAAAVIGGASLAGGQGSIGGAVLGAMFLTLIGNSLNLMGSLQIWHVLLVKGSVILIGVSISAWRNARLRRTVAA
ncbi:MAG TPA: ABC transporter permease [Lacipirellulaceae bacterium]|nr:ABC transporter permease [Lacipirellulaceae bacterium]